MGLILIKLALVLLQLQILCGLVIRPYRLCRLVALVSASYPGRANMSPILDLFITLLQMGTWEGKPSISLLQMGTCGRTYAPALLENKHCTG